jgi:hypothetical protein
MRLNLGCGGKILPGWINVDKFVTCGPDQVVDLEQFPWPWPDNAVTDVLMSHVLEHLGAETAVYLGIIKELYRVCCDGAAITIVVPHPRHDNFLGDPTHVRAIVSDNLMLFSQAFNRECLARGAANTPLGLYLGVDLTVESISYDLAAPWKELHEQQKVTAAELQNAIRSYNNVIQQITMVARAIKPAGRTSALDPSAAKKLDTPLSPDQPAGSNEKLAPLRAT